MLWVLKICDTVFKRRSFPWLQKASILWRAVDSVDLALLGLIHCQEGTERP